LRKEEVGVAIQQWEYIIVDVRLWRSGEPVYINGHPIERLAHSTGRATEYEEGPVPSLYEVLEWLGKNGWEMTGIAPDEHYSKIFFKRPLQPKATLTAPPPMPRLTSGHGPTAPETPTAPRPPSKKVPK
jgi:hypothetical protein